jgi:hypothetical protein
MADVQPSKMAAKLAPVNVETWSVKFDNNGNHTILMWLLSPYLCNNGPHSSTNRLTTVTMVGNVTVETKLRSLP